MLGKLMELYHFTFTAVPGLSCKTEAENSFKDNIMMEIE